MGVIIVGGGGFAPWQSREPKTWTKLLPQQGNRISSLFTSNVCHPDPEPREGEGSAVVFPCVRDVEPAPVCWK
jgi:hypothetical protein